MGVYVNLSEHETNINTTIKGRRWKIRFIPKLVNKDKQFIYGLCNYTDKQISIRTEQKEYSLINTLIHEVIHAQCEWIDDDYVHDLADVLTRILKDLI